MGVEQVGSECGVYEGTGDLLYAGVPVGEPYSLVDCSRGYSTVRA